MTSIAWTNETWNPLVGCSKVSAGCRACYAIRQAWRNVHMPHTRERYAGTVEKTGGGLNWTGRVNLAESVLDKPLRWRKPRRIFVNSMSDLFHPAVPDEWIDRIFAVMALSPQHTFQVLTKRPERMRAYLRTVTLARWMAASAAHPKAQSVPAVFPLPNVWLGTSVEDQATADARIPLLLQTPAAVRFISAEPLLGPVDLDPVRCPTCYGEATSWTDVPPGTPEGICGQPWCDDCDDECGGIAWLDPDGIDWVIVGGESGSGARPCDVAWIESIRDQCVAAGVPLFVKQDSGAKPGKQGRLSDALWARKEFPRV